MVLAAEVTGHPAVAMALGIGTVGLGGFVVAMAWSVHARQIRLAERIARRQPVVTASAGAAGTTVAEDTGVAMAGRARAALAIEGPDTVVSGMAATYRLGPDSPWQVLSWTVSGGSFAQTYDQGDRGQLTVMAGSPGSLQVTVRATDGTTEQTSTKLVTVEEAATAVRPSFTVRLFLQGWGLVVVAIVIVGFAGTLGALGVFPSSDFVALVSPLAALLGVVAIARTGADGTGHATPEKDSKDP